MPPRLDAQGRRTPLCTALTWLLWVLRSFRRFTLAYITLLIEFRFVTQGPKTHRLLGIIYGDTTKNRREVFHFISFGHFYSAPSSPLLLRGAPDYSMDTVSEFHAEAHRQL